MKTQRQPKLTTAQKDLLANQRHAVWQLAKTYTEKRRALRAEQDHETSTMNERHWHERLAAGLKGRGNRAT